MASLLAGLLLAGCAGSSARPAGGSAGESKVYQGPGFTARLPETVQFCMNKPPAPDHGFVALLRSQDCLRSDRLPRIELINSDMPRRPTDQAEMLVANICFTGKAKPAGFAAGGMPVSECIDDGEIGGLSYRQYFLHRRNATDSGLWSMLIVYVFSPRENLAADAVTARDVITGIDWR
jgi:hypothetical protein